MVSRLWCLRFSATVPWLPKLPQRPQPRPKPRQNDNMYCATEEFVLHRQQYLRGLRSCCVTCARALDAATSVQAARTPASSHMQPLASTCVRFLACVCLLAVGSSATIEQPRLPGAEIQKLLLLTKLLAKLSRKKPCFTWRRSAKRDSGSGLHIIAICAVSLQKELPCQLRQQPLPPCHLHWQLLTPCSQQCKTSALTAVWDVMTPLAVCRDSYVVALADRWFLGL